MHVMLRTMPTAENPSSKLQGAVYEWIWNIIHREGKKLFTGDI